MHIQRRRVNIIGLAFALFWAVLFSFWLDRPNSASIDPALKPTVETLVSDGNHNFNPDIVEWNGYVYMCYVSSPYHWGNPGSKVIVKHSSDLSTWDTVLEVNGSEWIPGADIRDPKLLVIDDHLFLYALINPGGLLADPDVTIFTYTLNGTSWTPVRQAYTKDWCFWRPKLDPANTTAYVAAYYYQRGVVDLLSSTDGITWTNQSRILTGGDVSEAELTFLPNGQLLCVSRYPIGGLDPAGNNNGGTMISTSSAPYTNWTSKLDTLVRIDGSVIVNATGRLIAIGRSQPEQDPFLIQSGSIFAKKRTSLFLVNETTLTYLTDLPSSGDTGYAGAIIRGDDLIVAYYTSKSTTDLPWFAGWLFPTDLKLAIIPLSNLDAVIASPQSPNIGYPIGENIIVIGTIAITVLAIALFWNDTSPGMKWQWPTRLKKTLSKRSIAVLSIGLTALTWVAIFFLPATVNLLAGIAEIFISAQGMYQKKNDPLHVVLMCITIAGLALPWVLAFTVHGFIPGHVFLP
jgi:hypothetical protein